MGVDVASQDEDCGLVVQGVDDLIKSEGESGDECAAMVRAIVRTLRDAADSAVDANEIIGAIGDPESSSIARVKRFSAHLTAALSEIT